MAPGSPQDQNAEQEIFYRKALLEAQNEAIPDSLLVVDTKGKIISFNKHFVQLWRIPDEIIDAKDDKAALAFAMTQVQNPQEFMDRVNYCYAHTEEAAKEEVAFLDGRIIGRYGNAVVGENGVKYGWIWYFRDITEQKKIEKDLRDSEERYQNFIRQSTEGIWRCEVDQPISIHLSAKEQIDLFFEYGYLAECNNAMAKMYGFENAEGLVGTRLNQIFPRDKDSEDYFNYFIQSEYRAENVESKELDRNGQIKYFRNNLLGIIEEGKLVRAWGTQSDVTEQKISEDKLKESEAKFRTLTETLPELVWMTNEKGEQEYASSKWKQYSGIDPEDRNTWEELVHPNDLGAVSKAWAQSLASGKFYSHEVRFKSKTGEYKWHFVQGEPIKNKDGQIIKWIGSCTNIQSQKNITRELEKLVEERTSELQRSNEDLQQFAHVASHDLKEPVRKVMTFANRLKDEMKTSLTEKANSYLYKIESSAIRMYSMIDGVLLYSSLNALEQTKEHIDLNEVLDNIESDLEVPITELNGHINYNKLPVITGSSILIYQLFYNLINNALKFYRQGIRPEITVSEESIQPNDLSVNKLSTEKTYVKIQVTDNGIGFSDENAGKIFGAFTRLHAKDKYEGTGLGLALCKKIVERHGGIIWAQGKEGVGASFIMLLPRE
jgi:PAS domain S-box-containing protein